jgi:N-acetylmuramoyl-L-alanine amidase
MSAVVLSILGAAMIAIPVAATAAQAAPDTQTDISVPLPAPVPVTSAPGSISPDGKRCNAKSCGDVERKKSNKDSRRESKPKQEQPKQEQPQQEQPQQDESDRHTVFVDPAIGVCVNCLLADITL